MERIKLIILIVFCIAAWNKENISVSTYEKELMLSTSIDQVRKGSYNDDNVLDVNSNDLVHRTYGNSLSLNKGSTCYIYDLSVKEELGGEAYITIVNVLTGKEKIIEKFYHQNYVQYTVTENGVFRIYLISKKMSYDLTERVTVSHVCQNEPDGIVDCIS